MLGQGFEGLGPPYNNALPLLMEDCQFAIFLVTYIHLQDSELLLHPFTGSGAPPWGRAMGSGSGAS